MESTRFECPGCGKHLKAPVSLFGKTVTCPACKERICVPPGEVPKLEEFSGGDAAESQRRFSRRSLIVLTIVPILLIAGICFLFGSGRGRNSTSNQSTTPSLRVTAITGKGCENPTKPCSVWVLPDAEYNSWVKTGKEKVPAPQGTTPFLAENLKPGDYYIGIKCVIDYHQVGKKEGTVIPLWEEYFADDFPDDTTVTADASEEVKDKPGFYFLKVSLIKWYKVTVQPGRSTQIIGMFLHRDADPNAWVQYYPAKQVYEIKMPLEDQRLFWSEVAKRQPKNVLTAECCGLLTSLLRKGGRVCLPHPGSGTVSLDSQGTLSAVFTKGEMPLTVAKTDKPPIRQDGRRKGYGKRIEVRVTLEPAANYKGIVIGKLYLINMEIRNLTGREYQIGDYFRTVMREKDTPWDQFSMAASGRTQLDGAIDRQRYGSDATTIAQMEGPDNLIGLQFQGTNDLMQDTTFQRQNIELRAWWPRLLPAMATVTIRWPTFWFSDSSDTPRFLAGPSFSLGQEKWHCWVNVETHEVREIPAESQALRTIIASESEPLGLRCAAVRWLLECDIKNEKDLLPYLHRKGTPDALAVCAMQALMIWGSADAIDKILDSWKTRSLLPFLDDKNTKDYFTWSHHANAAVAVKKIESNERSR